MNPQSEEQKKQTQEIIDDFVEKTMRVLSFMPENLFNRFMKNVEIERSIVNVTTILTLQKEEREEFRRYAVRKALGLEGDEE